MKSIRMSTRTVEVLIGLLATSLIVTGIFLYALREPQRVTAAQNTQLRTDLDEAMSLYAENCSVCHGIQGEGIGVTPPLDHAGLRASDYDTLYKIISRGLYGTAMPAWSQEDGGPLSNYQIGEMVTLIQFGNWESVRDHVVNLGMAPLIPFNSEPDAAILEQIAKLPDGDVLSSGIQIFAQQCVACHGADGLGTQLAPALNDPSVRAMELSELERIVTNGVAGTLMAPWGVTLGVDGVDAVVRLIKSWGNVPAGAIPAPDRPVAVTEESLAWGSDSYQSNCSRCHGPDGQGTPRAPALNVKGFLEETSDAAIQQIVTFGVPGTAMPAWGDRMNAAEIQAIVGFLRSWEPTAPEVAEPARGGGPWWRSESSGGETQGPPWMRQTSASPPGGQNLPSGGLSPGGQPDMEQHQDGAPAHDGGGPPWASQPEAVPWWMQLDWRALLLVVGPALSGSLLILVAASKLRHIERENISK